MPKYTISVPEVHRRTAVVTADTFDDACGAVMNEELAVSWISDAEFSSTMDPGGSAEWLLLSEEV